MLRARSSEDAGGFDQASTGSLVHWVLFSLLTVATGVAWERRRGSCCATEHHGRRGTARSSAAR